MKKLLVPTDFSANATNAIEYAIDIANTFGSEIHLVNTFEVYKSAGMLVSVEEYVRKDAEEQMDALRKRFEERLRDGATFKTSVMRGNPVQTISQLSKAEKTDLIIMGTQGASGLKEIFIGSTANGVIRNADAPVLVIPRDYQGRPPLQVIILAMDTNPVSSSNVMGALRQIARAYDAKVRVYHKDTGEDDPGVDPSVDIFLEGVDHSFHYELDGDSVNESINQFADDYEADLLCMIRRERGFFEDLFHASVTRREAFHSDVPLLVMHDGMQ